MLTKDIFDILGANRLKNDEKSVHPTSSCLEFFQTLAFVGGVDCNLMPDRIL